MQDIHQKNWAPLVLPFRSLQIIATDADR